MSTIEFCENRKLAEESTYRYLAAALTWTVVEPDGSGCGAVY